jgi:hypothetical protein
MPHLYGSLGCPAFRIASISQSAMALHSYRFRLSRAQNDARESMRSSTNFHPEWGYLAPAPSFIRRARFVPIATAVGVTFGAGAVLSWISHQATESSVAERTLVRPTEQLVVNSRSADGGAKEPSTSSTPQAPVGIAALTETATATEGPPPSTTAARPVAAKQPVLNLAPIKKKVMKKSNMTWRFALRDEPPGLARGEYYKRRSWGEYYSDGGGRNYENW